MRSHLALALLPLWFASAATATELVYVPTNPSFGGNPLNGAYLLSNAQAQNAHRDESRPDPGSQTELQRFNDRLQRAVLDRIVNAVTGSIIGENGIRPGTLDTQDFSINVVDLGNGSVRITTVDKASGASTSFEVSNTF